MSCVAAHEQTRWLGLMEAEWNGLSLAEVHDDARIEELLSAGVVFADV